MIREAYRIIHYALHSDAAVVTVNKTDYPILKASNGCRYVTFEGVRIMQQNKYKSSVWAQKARKGEKISWAMTEPSWVRIDEETLNPPVIPQVKKQVEQPKTKDNADLSKLGSRSQAGSDPLKKVAGAGDHRVTRKLWRP